MRERKIIGFAGRMKHCLITVLNCNEGKEERQTFSKCAFKPSQQYEETHFKKKNTLQVYSLLHIRNNLHSDSEVVQYYLTVKTFWMLFKNKFVKLS